MFGAGIKYLRERNIPMKEWITNPSIRMYLLQKRKTIMPMPWFIHVGVTNKCNLSCTYCLREEANEPMYSMSYETFLPLLDNPNLRCVKFHGMGEPLLCTDLEKMVKECKRRGLTTEIVTNGTLIDRFPEVIDYIDVLHISTDAFTERKAGEMRGVSMYKLKDTLLKLKALYPNQKQGFMTVLTKDNVEECKLISEWCKKHGFLHAINRLNNWLSITEPNWQEIHDKTIEKRLFQEDKWWKTCPWGFWHGYYNYEGKFQPCCVRYYKRYEIPGGWNGTEMKEFRDYREIMSVCKECPD